MLPLSPRSPRPPRESGNLASPSGGASQAIDASSNSTPSVDQTRIDRQALHATSNTPAAPARPKACTCDHCGLPVPAGLIKADADLQFCCAACDTVYHTLHACGLDAYYHLRQATPGSGGPGANSGGAAASSGGGGGYKAFDHGVFVAAHVETINAHQAKVRFALQGVHCAACLWLIERLPKVIDGVHESRLAMRTATVDITFDPNTVKLSAIAQALCNLGYPPSPAIESEQQKAQRLHARKRMLHLAIAGCCAGNTMLLAIALYAGWFSGMEHAYENLFRYVSMGIAIVALAWPGATFFKGALAAIKARTVNLDVPIALALAVGATAGTANVLLGRGEVYFDSLSILVFLLLVGRFVQEAQIRRAQDAVHLLHALIPTVARLVQTQAHAQAESNAQTQADTQTTVIEVPAASLGTGDVVEVRAGDIIPADATVTEGHSAVDEKLLTGESQPIEVQPGDAVLAGCTNQGGTLRLQVTAAGADTRAGKLMALVESHLKDKAPVQQLADKIAGYFVVVIACIALLVFIGWARIDLGQAIDHTVALLIVACPCALGLATPLTLAMAIATAAKHNILIKGASVLQKLAAISPNDAQRGRIVFDKTGTLTEGQPTLVETHGDTAWLPAVLAVEKQANHPIAHALVRALQDHAPAADHIAIANTTDHGQGGVQADATTADGQPVTIRIGTPAFVSNQTSAVDPDAAPAAIPADWQSTWQQLIDQGTTPIAVSVSKPNALHTNDAADKPTWVLALGLCDWLRPEAPQAVADLKAMGFDPTVLSGDEQTVVHRIGQEAGIPKDQCLGRLLPEAKLTTLRNWQSQGFIAMVGDGVNDAPALAAADVSIAVHASAEASLAAADVCIARPGLDALPQLVTIARRAMAAAKRNLAVSLAYNAIAVTLAAAGLLHPLVAAVLMPISSLTVLTLAATSQQAWFGTKASRPR